jgi:hypothetical protein
VESTNSQHDRIPNISTISELNEQYAASLEELQTIIDRFTAREKRGGGTVTDAEDARCNALLTDLGQLEERIKEEKEFRGKHDRLAEARAELRGGSVSTHDGVRVSVKGEPMVYGNGAPNSHYADMITLTRRSVVDPGYIAAQQRMFQWSNQVEHEVADGSKFGQVAERQLREVYRNENPAQAQQVMMEVRSRGAVAGDLKAESRAIQTGGGTTASAAGGGAAAFVTPIFGKPYIPYREYGRAFADVCFKGDLPDYGLAIYKPVVTGPAGVSQQTEAQIASGGVTEVDPSAGYQVATLVIFSGQVTLTQAVLDRMAPDYRFDVMCEDQLKRDYDPKFDKYVLAQALANATSQNWPGKNPGFELVASTLPGSGGFYGQVGMAKATMRKLVGTVLNPSTLFMDPARYEYIAAWSDVNGRPVVVPDYAGPYNAMANSGDGDAGIEGYTGTRMNGLPVFTDANIPTTGGTAALDQALVSDLQEVEVYEGNAINRVLPQTLASNMETILQRYSYATVLVNYNAAVTSINGTGMSAITYVG